MIANGFKIGLSTEKNGIIILSNKRQLRGRLSFINMCDNAKLLQAVIYDKGGPEGPWACTINISQSYLLQSYIAIQFGA